MLEIFLATKSKATINCSPCFFPQPCICYSHGGLGELLQDNVDLIGREEIFVQQMMRGGAAWGPWGTG
jgi:hypothetical protein